MGAAKTLRVNQSTVHRRLTEFEPARADGRTAGVDVKRSFKIEARTSSWGASGPSWSFPFRCSPRKTEWHSLGPGEVQTAYRRVRFPLPQWRRQPKTAFRPATGVPSGDSIHTSSDQRAASRHNWRVIFPLSRPAALALFPTLA